MNGQLTGRAGGKGLVCSCRLGLAFAISLIALGAFGSSAANAYVYWANSFEGGTIGRANLDGTGANQSLAQAGVVEFGLGDFPGGISVDADHLYWGNNVTIGRSNLDGSGTDNSFVPAPDTPTATAVDANFVYWANKDTGKIGRANLDGSSPNQNFIDGGTRAAGIAVDSSHIYWTDLDTGDIGRANLDGSSPDQNFIDLDPGFDATYAVAVDAGHIYWVAAQWSTGVGGTIGRADLDGSNPDPNFITGLAAPSGIATDAGHIYWSDTLGNSIGRANLDGTAPDPDFITGAISPAGVAVDATPFTPAHTVHRKLTVGYGYQWRLATSPFLVPPRAFAGNLSVTDSLNDPGCKSDRTISIFRQRKGRDPRVGTAKSDGAGLYHLIRPPKPGIYYATTAKVNVKSAAFGDATCFAARSKWIRVR